MASITVRNLDERLKRRLRVRAAVNGRSMEQEVREILEAVLRDEFAPRPEDLGSAIRARFAPLGGVELELPSRDPSHDPIPEPPTFE